jgi:hypothetical protein
MEVQNQVVPQTEATEQTQEVQAPSAETPAETGNEAQLYELPDGRKVDAATLASEWKSQFMPDYTRKSQELAALKRGQASQKHVVPQQETPDYSERPWEDPTYTPTTLAEVYELADRRAAYLAEQKAAAVAAEQQRIDQTIESQLAEIKNLDPEASADLIFAHATKYGFTNLVNAYKNMTAFNVAVKHAEQKAVQNIAKRGVNGQFQPAGATGAADNDAPVWGDTESPFDMLKRLNAVKT